MRFFKANERPMSAEDELVAARLIALSNRTKAAFSTRPSWEEPLELGEVASDALEVREVLQ
jgi:hypothetical protein